jgi:RNA recognition motif-containing protein
MKPPSSSRQAEMSHDPATGRSKGFCFIDYEDAASAEAAKAMVSASVV